MTLAEKTNSSNVRLLNTIAVDDASKQITVKFGGATSGTYAFTVIHQEFGRLDTSAVELLVESRVTDVTPKTGSIYGGTLLTITGTNFGTEKTDNPVQISFNGGVGSLDCFVQTTSATQITCRVDDSEGKQRANGDVGTVVVFLKTSEEAKCDASVCQNYLFTSTLPTVTAVQAAYDDAAHVWQVQVAGSAFLSQGTAATLFVGDVEQTMDSITSTLVTFHLAAVPRQSVTGLKLYFDIGKPAGYALLSAGVTIEPKIKQVQPSQGTTQGTLMVIEAPGVGSSETGYSVTDAAGVSLCRSVTAVAYGRLECLTNQAVIAST